MPINVIETGLRTPDYFRIFIEEPQEAEAKERGDMPTFVPGDPHEDEADAFADALTAMEVNPERKVTIQRAINGPDSEHWFRY